MEIIQETTRWNYSNGTYAISKQKIVAYRPVDGEVKVFTKPLTFDRRGRNFKKVTDNELKLKAMAGPK